MSNNLLAIMQSKHKTPWEFNFDNMYARPLLSYLTKEDIEKLKRTAMSVKLSSKIKEKQRIIGDIMSARGFRRFAGGTNRLVFACYEDPSILIKVAIDRVGMNDNPDELRAQQFIKPFCSKMFEVSPCGTVGLCERVTPITDKEQFKLIADEVFEIIVRKIVGRYVMDDIGTNYFLNWGIRTGFGPVLVDFPYLYNTDGDKLFCNRILESGLRCNGEIDYDAGFNHLYCLKCGKQYKAIDLKSDIGQNKIIMHSPIGGGDTNMRVKVVVNGQEIILGNEEHEVMRPERKNKFGGLLISETDISFTSKNEETSVEETEEKVVSKTIQIPDGFELEEREDDDNSEEQQITDDNSSEEQPISDDSGSEEQQTVDSDKSDEIATDGDLSATVSYNSSGRILAYDGGNRIKTRRGTKFITMRTGTNPAQATKGDKK